MLNIIPISEITYRGSSIAESITCPLCNNDFVHEDAKARHLEARHPGWALSMMSAYLRQIPHENG
jgi:hypothetical protein